jgi:hypothetical protein
MCTVIFYSSIFVFHDWIEKILCKLMMECELSKKHKPVSINIYIDAKSKTIKLDPTEMKKCHKKQHLKIGDYSLYMIYPAEKYKKVTNLVIDDIICNCNKDSSDDCTGEIEREAIQQQDRLLDKARIGGISINKDENYEDEQLDAKYFKFPVVWSEDKKTFCMANDNFEWKNSMEDVISKYMDPQIDNLLTFKIYSLDGKIFLGSIIGLLHPSNKEKLITTHNEINAIKCLEHIYHK